MNAVSGPTAGANPSMALSRSYRWEIPRGVSRMTRNSSVAVRTLSMAQSVFEQRIVGIDVARQLRHYGALGLRRGRALARRQIPSTDLGYTDGREAPATKHEVACRRTLRSRCRPGVRRDPVSGLLRSSPVSSQRHRRPPDLDVPRHAGRTAPAALTVEPLAAPGAWAFTNGSYFGHARIG